MIILPNKILIFSAIFMLRDPTFLDKVPDDYKKFFIDSDPIAPYKLQMLKKMVAERFSVSSI